MISFAQNYLNRGFWGDEAWTSLISQLPYTQMLKTTAADFHPPGYYTVIEILYIFLPPTEINTRLVSVAFYLLTLLMIYKLARYVRGRIFGAATTLTVALNPIFFTYAFEARNYTMFAFAATGSCFFLIELSKKFNVFRAVAFILFAALGIYTHYYMFFILASQGLYLLLFDRKILFKMIGLYLIVGFLYLPWLPYLYKQLSSVSESYWIGSIDKRTHYEALLRILGGEHKNMFRPFLFGLSISLLAMGILQHALKRDPQITSGPRFEKPYLLIWLWAIVPIVVATLPGFKIFDFQFPFRPIFFWRYLIGSSIPLSMVMVHAAQKFPRKMTALVMAVVILSSLSIDVLTLTRYPRGFKQEYQEKIVGKINEPDKIVTVLPSFAEVFYYRNRNYLQNDLIVLPEGLVQSSGKSLLDAYVENGAVTIGDEPSREYFEALPGPEVRYKVKSQL
jgi:4-amino-4-deoxy-L-arabinose transferase-like glycosyltransferase